MAEENGYLKLIFTRDRVLVVKSVEFGVFGAVDSSIEYGYNEFPMSFGDKPLIVTKIEPCLENGVLKSLEFTVLDYKKESVRREQEYRKYDVSKMTLVGSCTSLKAKKPYKVYMNKRAYYIQAEFGTHIVRFAMTHHDFDKCLKWLRQQPLPNYFLKLESEVIKQRVMSSGHFWNFLIIGLAKGVIKAHLDEKTSQTIISLP